MSPEIFISRDGQQYGPYSVQDLESHIADGSISPEDLAWIGEDHSEWKPLRELIDIEVSDGPAAEALDSPAVAEASGKTAESIAKPSAGNRVWRAIYRGSIVLAILFAGLCAVAVFLNDEEPELDAHSQTTPPAPDENGGENSREIKVETTKAEVPSNSESEKPKRTPLFGMRATDANVLEIIEAYDSNPLAGDQRYKGQRLRVTGIVRQVRETPAGDGYFATIQPAKGLPLNSRKAVSIRTKDEKALATFEAGSVVTVVGDMTGLDLMDYPRIDSAVIERQASALSPIPGAVFDWTKEERPELDFKDAKVQQAAKLYLTSLNNQIANGFMPDYGSMDQARLAEVVLLEEGPRHSFFRIAMTGMRGSRPLLNYAFVVVEQKPDGSFPEVNSESYLINTVVQCGPKPTGEHMFTVKRANGWTLKDGWPD